MKSNASTLHLSQPPRHPQDDGHHHHKDLPPLQSTPSTADISAGSGPLPDEGDTKHHVLALDATSSSPSGAGQFDEQRHSSSQQDLSAGGYGWYDNDEGLGSMSPYGRGDNDGDDSRGRGGGDQHVSVLSRMETFREDMMERTTSIGKEEGEEEGEKGQEERHLQQQQDGSHAQHQHHHHHHRQSIADESSSSSKRMHSININGRQHDHRNSDKEILFHLPRTNFSVMTRQFLDADDVDEFRRSSTSRESMHHHHHHLHHQHHHHDHHYQGHKGQRKRKKQPVYAALGVGGLRICQTLCGGQHAEFLVCLCLNQQTFVAWKRFSAFAQLYQDVHVEHDADVLPATRRAWGTLESRRKWWRCLEIRYLAQKLTFLESFLGAFLTEVSSPTLLMTFASSDVTPKGFAHHGPGMAAEMHDMSGGSAGGRNMVVNNSASQEELLLRQKVLQAGPVGGGDGGEREGEGEGVGGR